MGFVTDHSLAGDSPSYVLWYDGEKQRGGEEEGQWEASYGGLEVSTSSLKLLQFTQLA